jgi:hypothetical protein
MRRVIPIARESMPHNRGRGNVDKTNALCYASVHVVGRHEQHHVPRDLRVNLV